MINNFYNDTRSIPARGAEWLSAAGGCGAVEYIYWNKRSEFLLGIPPPLSDICKHEIIIY